MICISWGRRCLAVAALVGIASLFVILMSVAVPRPPKDLTVLPFEEDLQA